MVAPSSSRLRLLAPVPRAGAADLGFDVGDLIEHRAGLPPVGETA